jgi:hypothetical protein
MTFAKSGMQPRRPSAVGISGGATVLPIAGAATDWQSYTVARAWNDLAQYRPRPEHDWINPRNGLGTPVNFATTGIRGSTLTRDIDPDTHLFVSRLSYKLVGPHTCR